jgi:UPF0243 zinc-binding protein RSc2830
MSETPSVRTVACPTCRRPVVWTAESRYRPFCSERCRLIDLGAWSDERHVVPCADDDPDFDGLPPH